jgi:hypothetical protein
MRRPASAAPSSASLSRHGAMPRMPWRAQPSIICASDHLSFTVAVFSDSARGSGAPSDAPSAAALDAALTARCRA